MKLKTYLRKVAINNGGYDRGGRYWGIGAPLYEAEIELDGHYEKTIHFRAASRADAKGKLDLQLAVLGFKRVKG